MIISKVKIQIICCISEIHIPIYYIILRTAKHCPNMMWRCKTHSVIGTHPRPFTTPSWVLARYYLYNNNKTTRAQYSTDAPRCWISIEPVNSPFQWVPALIEPDRAHFIHGEHEELFSTMQMQVRPSMWDQPITWFSPDFCHWKPTPDVEYFDWSKDYFNHALMGHCRITLYMYVHVWSNFDQFVCTVGWYRCWDRGGRGRGWGERH